MVRVMIIAAYAEVREGLSMVLRLAGDVEVCSADSLTCAVEQAGAACPEVVLVDLEMPEGEGYAVIRLFRRMFPGVRVIALTAHDYPAARESALQAGASVVMVKGLEAGKMVEIIEIAGRADTNNHTYKI